VTGCPAAYEPITVAAAEQAGYLSSPHIVDELGNHNGLVCRRPLPEVFLRKVCDNQCPVPTLYDWRDDFVLKT